MRETRVDVDEGGGEKISRTRSGRTGMWWSSLVPKFDETISPEFYKLSGKLRAIGNLLFIASNLALAPRVDALGFDPHVHVRAVPLFITVHLIDLTLALLLWRGSLTRVTMRRITYACVVLESLATIAASWVYGSVNSPFIGVALVFILIYRLSFDYRIGVTAFVLIIAGYWGVVIAELTHVLPPQPIAPGVVDGVYGSSVREIGAMINLTVVITLTFVVAHWAVARMRHKDVAIRMLRESLYAAEQGKIGRHTGRTLRDTYTLGVLLGAGGMGEVYTGTHMRTQRKVAIKMLHPHLVEDRQVLTRFRREAEIIGKLGSEHIIEVIDIDSDTEDGQPFLVLELMLGESLAQRIARRGPLSLTELADVVDQLARGLDVAHRAEIVHRDLKPENVFLNPRADGGTAVKILDFGVSKIGGAVTAITQEIAILGTPDYMSPEQATGHADDVKAASDLFSLGALTYAAATGHRPFEASSVPALLRKICDEEPVPITELRAEMSPAIANVIAIAMAKRASERYASATDFSRDLRAAITGTLDAAIAERANKLTRGRPGKRMPRHDIDTTGATHAG